MSPSRWGRRRTPKGAARYQVGAWGGLCLAAQVLLQALPGCTLPPRQRGRLAPWFLEPMGSWNQIIGWHLLTVGQSNSFVKQGPCLLICCGDDMSLCIKGLEVPALSS